MQLVHWLYTIPLRLRSLFRRRRADHELDDELRDHVARKTQDYIAKGMTSQEARRTSLIELGGLEQAKEECRDTRRVRWLQDFAQDLRFGLRMLRKSPGFTIVAVLTLALGIGANTSILAVMKAVLRPKLPYAHPEQLADVYNRNLKVTWDDQEAMSIPLWQDLRNRNHSFDELAAFTWFHYFNLSGSGVAARIRVSQVSPNVFSVLGLEPMLGRGFRDDETSPGRDHVVILSDRLWKKSFDGRADVLGQAIQLSRQTYTVIGVLPENFQLGTLSDKVDALLPLDTAGPDSGRRDLRTVAAIGRLKPKVTLAAAQTDLSAIAGQAAKAYPATDGGWGSNAVSLHDDSIPFGATRLTIFLGLAFLVLLVACLNITVLLSAQAETRKQEFAIRAALGASRRRLLRQSVCESGLLAVLGTAAALVLANWGTRLLIRYTPADFLNSIHQAPLDFSIMIAAAGMCAFTILLIGLLPALSSFGADLNRQLGRGSARVARGRRGFALLVGGEIAIGLALIVSASVLTRSLHAISTLDAGFDPRSVVSARVTLDPAVYPSNASRLAFFNRFLSDVQGRPGMFVAAGSALPLTDAGWLDNTVSIPGAKPSTGTQNDLNCFSVFVYPGYFAALKTPILFGRDFASSESDPVVIINEAFAREYFPGQNPVGKLVLFLPNTNVDYNGASTGPRRVIGVVRNFRDNAVRYNAATFATAYFDFAQNPMASMDVIVRSSNADAAVSLLRDEASRMDSAEPLYDIDSMPDEWQRSLGSWEFQSWFAGLGAALALLLSAIGVFGVVSHAVRQRTREIGIRIALGGQSAHIILAMMKRVSRAIGAGIACGLLAAYALTHQLSSLLFQVAPFDLVSFVLGAFLLAAIAVLASYVPARRAIKVDPMVALRYE